MAPVIETARLVLRLPDAADEPAFAAFLMSERAVHVGGPATRGRAWRAFAHCLGQWEMRGYGVFTMVERASGEPIGWCGFFHPVEMDEPEISWSIWVPEFEGRGFAFEAALAVRDHAYGTLGWRTVTSNIDDGNHRSVALAGRLGCVLERSYDEDGTMVHLYRHPPAADLAGDGGMEAYA